MCVKNCVKSVVTRSIPYNYIYICDVILGKQTICVVIICLEAIYIVKFVERKSETGIQLSNYPMRFE